MNSPLEIAKRLQALAQSGLAYSQNEYDIERYEEIRELSVSLMHHLSGAPVEKITRLFAFEEGYQTPKVDVRAVVFKEGKLLMVHEKIDGLWALPGGWADIGYSPAEVAVKEVEEEAGLRVKAVRLLAIMDKNKHPHPPAAYHTYKLFILCEPLGGVESPGMETHAVGYFGADGLPPLSEERNTASQLAMLFGFSQNPGQETYFD